MMISRKSRNGNKERLHNKIFVKYVFICISLFWSKATLQCISLQNQSIDQSIDRLYFAYSWCFEVERIFSPTNVHWVSPSINGVCYVNCQMMKSGYSIDSSACLCLDKWFCDQLTCRSKRAYAWLDTKSEKYHAASIFCYINSRVTLALWIWSVILSI